ncbi:hypothetical protein [Halobaculum sp. P14]|uniref:hypothetical protein n=1 Tax=Halobaculum sp. P14 TaxID=3421638 RepID=UPI003EC0B658
MTAETRGACVQCGDEFGSPSRTNFCTVCCHNGLDDDLLDEYGFFVTDEADDADNIQLDSEETAATQAGLGDFT